MKMREAVFYSSKDAAVYSRPANGKEYSIRVEEGEEEYTPSFLFFRETPGPHFRTVYHCLVSIAKDGVIQEPHQSWKFYDIDACEDYLHTWRIDTERDWTPDEEQSQAV